jgi:formylglycine-generating enzyme required for sulfatase activity
MISVRGVARMAVVVAMVIAACAGAASANVFKMGDGLTSLEFVTVGNPGNAADPETGYGGVAYTFNIGKFEVTAGQYTAFLNAVAKTDTYGLYSTNMWSDTYGCKIQCSGSSGSYTYSVASDRANRPVSYVSWGDAARFANWLTHGQPTGAQDLTTTEDGSYYLNGAITHEALLAVTRIADGDRTPGKKYYFIPTEDEWYKAAYHKNDGVTGNYWDYSTGSDNVPGRNMADASGNNANYYTNVVDLPIDSGKYTTLAGEFQNSDSPYGTFDQGGNVYEWNETIDSGSYRGLRGGAFDRYGVFSLSAAWRYDYHFDSVELTDESFFLGFRVSEVPEPATLSLLAVGGLLALRRRR